MRYYSHLNNIGSLAPPPRCPNHTNRHYLRTQIEGEPTVGRTNDQLQCQCGIQKALTLNDVTLAHGPKIDNLFMYTALPTSPDSTVMAKYSAEPSEITLWHHRLAHTSYSTLESMKRLQTTEGFNPSIQHGHITQCTSCPHGKQTRAPFRKTENLPDNIGDIVVSDICGPFEPSLTGFRYFITWMDLKTRFTNIEFLKNKALYQSHSRGTWPGSSAKRRLK